MNCYLLWGNLGDFLTPEDSHVCGSDTPAQYCCANGDTCEGDSICHFTHSQENTSGYYLGGCTDITFPGPACSEKCLSYQTNDIVYNSSSGLWACCWGSGTLDCKVPSDETFQAPAPEHLTNSSIFVASNTTSPTSTICSTTIRSLQSSSMNCPAVQTCTPDSGLSTGVRTGIGVGIGATVVSIGLLTVMILLIQRWSRRQKSIHQSGTRIKTAGHSPRSYIQKSVKGTDTSQSQELDSRAHMELMNGYRRAELR